MASLGAQPMVPIWTLPGFRESATYSVLSPSGSSLRSQIEQRRAAGSSWHDSIFPSPHHEVMGQMYLGQKDYWRFMREEAPITSDVHGWYKDTMAPWVTPDDPMDYAFGSAFAVGGLAAAWYIGGPVLFAAGLPPYESFYAGVALSNYLQYRY